MDNTNNKMYWEKYVDYWNDKVEEANSKCDKMEKTLSDQILEYYIKKLNIRSEDKILDFGCGFCRAYPVYKKLTKGYSYFGVDIAKAPLILAMQKYPELYNMLSETDGSCIPFEDNTFDKIICFGVFDACMQEVVLAELLRVLKKGGILLVTGKNNMYFDDDDDAYIAEINARKKGHPNYFTDIKSMERQLEGSIIDKYYFKRRGDFCSNKYITTGAPTRCFYEWLYYITKTEEKKWVFKKFSAPYSQTYLKKESGGKELLFRMNNKECSFDEVSRKSVWPELLMLELTNACNHACLFCDHDSMSRNIGNMDFNLAVKILQEAYEMGVREVALFLMGEPLLYKRLDEIIFQAKLIGFEYVYITTNGVLADLKTMKRLLNAGLDSVKFSINAIDRKSYAIVHGQDDYQRVIENLHNLYRYRNDECIECNIYVSSIKTKYNNSSRKIHEELDAWCDEVVVENCIDKLEVGSNRALKDRTDDDLDIIVGNRIPCQMIYNRLSVSCEGYLTACCSDIQNMLAYADLNQTSLKDAWSNKTICELRKKHLEGNLGESLCKICIGKPGEISPLHESLSSMALSVNKKDIEKKRILKYSGL